MNFNLLKQTMPAMPLPTIERTNVSNADGTPLMVGDVFRQVLMAMANSCVKNGKGVLPDDLLGQMGTQLASLKEIGGQITEIGGQLKDTAGEAVTGAAKSVTDGVSKAGDAAKDTLGKGSDTAKKAVDGVKGLLPGRKQ